MIISIAMLGIGTSGTILSLFPRLKEMSKTGIYCLAQGIGISLSYILSNRIPFDPVKLSWSEMQILYIGLYYIILSIPFFFAGLIVAASFSALSEKSGILYAADLIGAGMGSMGVLFLMIYAPPEKTVFVISVIALSAAFISGGKRLKIASLTVILLTISLPFYDAFTGIKMSPYKGLQTAIKYPGAEHLKTYFSPYTRIDTLKSPAARFAPGLSLKYTDDLPAQIGVSIDGGDVNAVTSHDDNKALEFLRYLPSALPYEIVTEPELTDISNARSPAHPTFSSEWLKRDKERLTVMRSQNKDVLILDPKGGLECLIAEYYGSSSIYKIESNPLLVNIIQNDLNGFSGGIYSRNTRTGIGRSWLKSGGMGFDIIDIPLTGNSPSGTFGIAEDYKLTVEAFREYITHLKTGGILSIHTFIIPPPRIDLRVLITLVSAMEELGIQDVKNHIVAIRSWGTVCILMKKSEFSLHDIRAIKKFSKNMRFDLIYYPGISEEETNLYVHMPSNEYFSAFINLLDKEKSVRFIDSYIFDIKPVRDENPFFHYYLKFKNINEIYNTMGRKWQYFIEEGYILPAVFFQVLFFGLILMILPAISTAGYKVKAEKKDNLTPGLSLLPYFAFLGTGFMFVEVSLVHKMILPLENPSYAVATVITSILISSGTGSLLSYKFSALRNRAVSLAIPLLIILYSIFLPHIFAFLYLQHLPVRILLVSLSLIPLALLMGIPFPTGLKILGERNKSLIPWAWSVNACLSVLAPVLTIMIAISFGFTVVLYLGSLSYLLAFLILRFVMKNMSSENRMQ